VRFEGVNVFVGTPAVMSWVFADAAVDGSAAAAASSVRTTRVRRM
jgi:hypothetical protein